MRKKLCLGSLQNEVMLLIESERNGALKSGNTMVEFGW